MATKVGDMYAELKLKKEGFEKNLTASQKSIQRFKANAKVAFQAMAIAAAAVTAELFRASKAAMEQEKSVRALTSIMTDLKLATQEEIDALIDYSKAIQLTTAYSDEEAQSAMAMLGTFQLNAKQINEIMPRLLDMASSVSMIEGRHISLVDAAKRFGMAMNDNVGLLKRWGVVLNEEAIAADRYNGMLISIDENYKGQAATYITTTEGAMKRMKNMYGELEEALGQGLLPYLREYIKLLTEDMMEADGLTSQLKDIGTWIGRTGIILMRFVNNAREMMTDFGAHITNGIAGLLELGIHLPKIGKKFENAAHSVRMLNQGFVQQGIDLQANEDKYNKMLENLIQTETTINNIVAASPPGTPEGALLPPLFDPEMIIELEDLKFIEPEIVEPMEDLSKLTEMVAENMGEMFGTMIKSGGEVGAILKRLIGQLIRMLILSKMGPLGGALGGFMRVFGFQEGGMVTGMPMMNLRPNLAVANENPSIPELTVPLEKFKDLIQVNVKGAATADIFLDASKLPDDIKDKFTRDVTSPAMIRDTRR